MKKMLFGLVAGAASLVVFSGCATYTNDVASATKIKTTAHYEATYDYKPQKVSGEATVHSLFGIFTWGVSAVADDAFSSEYSFIPTAASKAKGGATYNACKANKADALLAAKYVVEDEDYFVYRKVKATVSGLPATLKEVKQVPSK